jgi:hypothetical protein
MNIRESFSPQNLQAISDIVLPNVQSEGALVDFIVYLPSPLAHVDPSLLGVGGSPIT